MRYSHSVKLVHKRQDKTDVNLLDKEFGHYIIFAFEFSIEVLEHDSNHLYEGEDQSAERHRTRVVTASEM